MRALITILFLLAVSSELLAQEPVFSQFYSSGLYLNPALAGVESETYFGANYRSQWNNLSLPFNTFQASVIQPISQRGAGKKHLGGVGASMLNDVAGPNKELVSQALSLAGAWNFHLNESGNHIVTIALQGGVSQQRVNYENLQWSSQYAVGGYDPTLPGEAAMAGTRIFQPIINSGLMWSYSTNKIKASRNGVSFYNGLAVTNLTKSNSYFSTAEGRRDLIFKNHGGLTTHVSRQLDISPNYLIQVQGANKQVNIGAYAGYSLGQRTSETTFTIIGGAWYRVHDGLIFSTGISTNNLNVGFTYDNNMSSMGKSFGYAGAYELSLAYRVPGKQNFKRISSPLI